MLGGMCALQGLSAVVMNARPTTPHQPSQEIGGTPRRYARQVVVIAIPAPPSISAPINFNKNYHTPFSNRFFFACSVKPAAALTPLRWTRFESAVHAIRWLQSTPSSSSKALQPTTDPTTKAKMVYTIFITIKTVLVLVL